MLTKTDLSQIRKVVREEVESESKSLSEDLQGEIKLARIKIQNDIYTLANRVKNLELVTSKVQKDIKSIVRFFDKEYLQVRKRIKQIEDHLHLSAIQ